MDIPQNILIFCKRGNWNTGATCSEDMPGKLFTNKLKSYNGYLQKQNNLFFCFCVAPNGE